MLRCSKDMAKHGKTWVRLALLGAEILLLGGFFVFFGDQIRLYSKYQSLIGSIEAVRQHEYSDSYKCLEFSRDLQAKLMSKGIASRIAIVKNSTDENAYHAVVSFQIEPQDGQIVSYEKIDECDFRDGRLDCAKGSILDGNMYIAGKK